jgi:hypothetical protein
VNSATVIKADEQEAAAFLWALDRDSFAELCGAFARHREAERARIVAWLFDWYDSGSVDGLICRSNGPDDFAAMLAQETQS